jgi:hypothetical protein
MCSIGPKRGHEPRSIDMKWGALIACRSSMVRREGPKAVLISRPHRERLMLSSHYCLSWSRSVTTLDSTFLISQLGMSLQGCSKACSDMRACKFQHKKCFQILFWIKCTFRTWNRSGTIFGTYLALNILDFVKEVHAIEYASLEEDPMDYSV